MPTPEGDRDGPARPVFVKPGQQPLPATAGVPADPSGRPVFVAPGHQGPVFVQAAGSPPPTDTDRPWRWWLGPLAAFIAFFPAIFVLYFGAQLLIGSGQQGIDDNEHWLGLAQDVVWVAVVLLVPYLAARHLRAGQLGLRRAPAGRAIGVLVGTLFTFYVLAALYSLALGLDENSNTLLKDTGFGDNLTRDIVFALVFTVAAPVAEELLFRGLLFRSLRDGFAARFGAKRGIAFAALLSGLIFGAAHVGGGQNDFLPVLMLLGIGLALAYQWSGTLYVSITIHSINNTIATGFNSTPSQDWVYGLIAAGPVIALIVAFLLSRFIGRVFPQDPPERAIAPPAGQSPEATANL